MWPSRVTTPRRSPSPSNARPRSCPPCAQQRDQVAQILGLRRVRVVVRKMAVDGAEHLRDVAAQPPEQRRREGAGDAVAAIHGDLQRSREPDVIRDAIDVGRRDVGAPQASRAGGEAPRVDARAQVLDVGAGKRGAVHHHLEAVVVGRIVAAGHHHARLRAEVMRGKVRHRRRDHADVDDVGARRTDSVRDRGRELRDRKAGRRDRPPSCRGRAPARASPAPGRSSARWAASATCRRRRECRRP